MAKESEVAVAGDTASTEVVLDDEHRNRRVLGITTGLRIPGLVKTI